MKLHAAALHHLGSQAKRILTRSHLGPAAMHHISRPLTPGFLFMRALWNNPRAVGACSPSSKMLSKVMAEQVPLPIKGLVVELGGGTGSVTQALLQRGIPAARLCVVEQSPVLAGLLRKRFPGVTIIQGDAGACQALLPGREPYVHAVVSSLPLLSLPKPVVINITREIQSMLARRGTLIQFTYRVGGTSPLAASFEPVRSQTILFNLPPAKVEVFRPRRLGRGIGKA